MAKKDLNPYLQNLSLKQEFELLGLELNEVMEFTPFDLDLENRRLQQLINFVKRYQDYGSRKIMETIENGYVFPPIFPGISPDSDWYRFEQWMQGKPVRKKVSEQMTEGTTFRKPGEIGDDEIEAELDRLEQALADAGFGIDLNPEIPPRLVYGYLYEELDETLELDMPGNGGWCLGGCGGYCPGCIQRPWCETGQSSCWGEDEEAGKMCLTEEVSTFVSASPQSLDILRELQAIQDASFEKFKNENPNPGFGDFEGDTDWKAGLN
jgi:hypothetical protein